MASNDWLPPGWTEEMLKTATEEQWDSLTDEQFGQAIAYKVARVQDKRAADQPKLGIAPTQPHHEPGSIEENVILALKHNSLLEFGFVVFRVYDDPDTDADAEKWLELKRQWPQLANDGRIRPEDTDEDTHDEHGHPWPTWKWIEEPKGSLLQTFERETIAQLISDMRVQGEVPPGLDRDVALVVTSECLQSFADTGSRTTPCVYAVDVNTGEGSSSGESDCDGYFKVTIRCLLTELWTTVADLLQTPDELEVLARSANGGVWDGDVWDGE